MTVSTSLQRPSCINAADRRGSFQAPHSSEGGVFSPHQLSAHCGNFKFALKLVFHPNYCHTHAPTDLPGGPAPTRAEQRPTRHLSYAP